MLRKEDEITLDSLRQLLLVELKEKSTEQQMKEFQLRRTTIRMNLKENDNDQTDTTSE